MAAQDEASLSLFVDTSVWYAAVDRGEHGHGRALEILEDESLLTTDHVLVESCLLMGRRLGRSVADQFWGRMRAGIAAIEPIAAADLEIAWAIRQAFPDQSFSIVDCTSFAVMQRLGVYRAASFDDDFAVYRFGPGRKRAFEVLR